MNKVYLERKKLNVHGTWFSWLDTGTHPSLVDATLFVKTVEDRQGLKIAFIEEIAYCMGYVDKEQMRRLAEPLKKSGYGDYLLKVIDGDGVDG